MNWPEAMVTIAGMICAVNLFKALLKFLAGNNGF
jgi:hypothetical protein